MAVTEEVRKRTLKLKLNSYDCGLTCILSQAGGKGVLIPMRYTIAILVGT